jgi:hypothetical protein
VHVVPAAEEPLLRPTHQLRQRLARVAVEPGDGVEASLVADRGEDSLVEFRVDEPFVIQRHELLRERGPAARRRDDEHRFPHLLPAEAGKKQVIEHSSKSHHEPHQPVKHREENHVSPATHAERGFEQRQILRLEEHSLRLTYASLSPRWFLA